MSEPLLLHPSELAYVFSYMRVGGIVGWGSALFTPPPGGADAFYRDGLARLRKAGRILPGKQPGRFRIDEAVSRIAYGFPHDMIASPDVGRLIDGQTVIEKPFRPH